MPDQVNFDLGVTLPVGKALTEAENGDLHIEGIAADYNPDRQDDVMLPGALDRAIKRYLGAGGPLLYHHKRDQLLGQVSELSPGPNGIAVKAVVPKPSDPGLRDHYDKIRRGMLRGLSVLGPAKIVERPGGGRVIGEIDLQEISITPQPVAPGAVFRVVKKALGEVDDAEAAELRRWFEARYDQIEADLSKAQLSSAARKNLPASAFVYPKERRYPIHDRAHGANALARSKGKSEEGKVRAAVCRRYPDLPACKS